MGKMNRNFHKVETSKAGTNEASKSSNRTKQLKITSTLTKRVTK